MSPAIHETPKIICIGRNYADHAIEMGHDPIKEPPFFFFKPLSAFASSGNFVLPKYSSEVHHELELVLKLQDGGRDMTESQAKDCIGAVAIGLDMTCRDIQREAKQQGRPWELAKGFDGSAPCSEFQPCTFDDLQAIGEMTLLKNQVLVQKGHWRDMTWGPTELLQYISQFIQLIAGDLIFTGTPAGVGPVAAGDTLEARVEGLRHSLQVHVKSSNSHPN